MGSRKGGKDVSGEVSVVLNWNRLEKKGELSGSRAGHKTKTIFIVSICKKAHPAPLPRPQAGSPQSAGGFLGSSCERGLAAGEEAPGCWARLPAEAQAERVPSHRHPPSFPTGPSSKFPPSFRSVPSLPPPPPIYSLSKNIKKRSTSLTSRNPFQ